MDLAKSRNTAGKLERSRANVAAEGTQADDRREWLHVATVKMPTFKSWVSVLNVDDLATACGGRTTHPLSSSTVGRVLSVSLEKSTYTSVLYKWSLLIALACIIRQALSGFSFLILETSLNAKFQLHGWLF